MHRALQLTAGCHKTESVAPTELLLKHGIQLDGVTTGFDRRPDSFLATTVSGSEGMSDTKLKHRSEARATTHLKSIHNRRLFSRANRGARI